MKALKKIQTKDPELSKVQDNMGEAISQVLSVPHLDGVLLEGITLISGKDNLINHQLGRPIRTWRLERLNANSVVWERTAPIPGVLNLWCSSNCTVSLWVS